MLKNELRKLYKLKRKALSDDEAFCFSERIFHRFVNEFNPKSGQSIHLFLTIDKLREIDTSFFIQYCFENKIEVFVPKIHDDELLAIQITPETKYEKNSWGVVEPISNVGFKGVDFDFVLTPLLYADEKGNRVGYGKGFYDGFFKKLAPRVKKIGLNYFEPNESIDDIWKEDVPLDYLVTPKRVLSFIGFGK